MPTYTYNPGHELAGRYRIVELLGVGQTAEVYLADDLSLNRSVVVKVLLADLAGHEDVRRNFRERIVRSATLSHPHLARVYDGGQESGSIFMISEYLSGGSFEDILTSGRRLSLDDVARLGRDVSSALAYVHANGFIHGSLSPSKLLFDGEGHVRVSDIALSGLGAGYRERQSLDDVRYLSPEQVLGEIVGPKTDVYSLALILFEAATGTTPFDGMTAEIALRSRINTPLPVRPELGTLDMLLAQAAVPDPLLRLDADQFASRLSTVLPDAAPLVVAPVRIIVPLLERFTPTEPRTSIGFRPPSADQIVGTGTGVHPVTSQFAHQGRHAVAGASGRDSDFRQIRSSPGRGYGALPPNRLAPQRRLGFLVAAVLIVVVAIAGATAWKLGVFTSKTAVPALSGKTLAQATTILQDDGFTLKENPPGQSATVPANEIMSQSPLAGTKAKAGTAITVKFSEGPDMVTMPAYLFGETCTIATTRLQRLGVTASCPSAKAIQSDRIASGEVARVLYGTTNNPVAVPKGATVILELSTGPGPSSGTTTTTTTTPTGATTTSTTTTTLAGQGDRAVPNVVGMNQAEVYAAMKKAVLYFSTTGPGAGTTQWTTVISQSPAAGTLVPYKSTVALHVGE
jgi:serine/threonine protein kinase/beta-lactam-binding protein with PASTA domain